VTPNGLLVRNTKFGNDFASRLKLVARVDRATLEESRTKRKELVLWLVESRPDSEVLGSP